MASRSQKATAALLLLLPTSAPGFVTPSSTFRQQLADKSCTSTSVSAFLSSSMKKIPGSADLGGIAWEDLGFGLRPTNSYIKITYTENEYGTGAWGEAGLVKEPYINLHIAATALHYGQSCLEGLKAFCHRDGTVHIFRPTDHAARMQTTCRRILMPELPSDKFVDAVERVVRDNVEYVPPYGSGGALYIRPLLFGSGPRIGVQPAAEYTFLILVIPVGNYYAGGLSQPVDGLLIGDFDRAAPRGVGGVKVAGNYAADMLPSKNSTESGYNIALYLDASTQSCIEEFSTSSFVGINTSARKYVTPQSGSVLCSITNMSLMQLAADKERLMVEARDIPVEELVTFDEVLAVGTGVVMTPVGSITRHLSGDKTQVYLFGEPGRIGATTQRLYNHVRAIQSGDADDVYGWNHKVEY